MLSQANHLLDPRLILEPNKSYSLTISNVTEDDQGVYLCNLLPQAITMHAKLIVLKPLKAHIYRADGRDVSQHSITYRENEPFEVECKAEGRKSNKIEYKWTADDNGLKSNDHLQIDGGKLIFKKPSYDDVGVYQCMADDGIDGVPGITKVTINIKCKCFPS